IIFPFCPKISDYWEKGREVHDWALQCCSSFFNMKGDFLPRKMKYRRLFGNISPNKKTKMPNSLLFIFGKRVVPKGIAVKSGIILVSESQRRQTVRSSPSAGERRLGICS